MKRLNERNKQLIEQLHRIRRFLGRTTLRVIFAVNIFSLILLCVSLSAWYISPAQSLIPSYLGLGFLVLFICNILFVCFWIIVLKWKPLIYNFIVIVLCWNPISTYLPIHFKTKTLPENSIKMMTYNVMGFNWATDEDARNNPIFEYMANSGADIVCMQEFVINNNQYNPDGVISISEIDKIMKDYPYRSILRFGKSYESKYSFGIACYSKFPILNTEEISFDTELNGAAVYEIKVKNKKVKLINVHLESNKLTSEDKKLYHDFINNASTELLEAVSQSINEKLGSSYLKRAEQAKIIVDLIKQLRKEGYPIILCGDFNDTPISYVYKKIQKGGGLIDSFAESGLGQGISYNQNMFWFRIDYIMHSQDISSYNANVDRVLYSDHYPLISYLKIN